MTQQDREAETQRLMATLAGDGGLIEITEQGAIEPIAADTTMEAPSCQFCYGWLDPDEGQDVMGLLFCEDCAPEAATLSQRQVVCLICDGKRLIFHGPGQGWQPCEMCHGAGWIDGIVARWNDAI